MAINISKSEIDKFLHMWQSGIGSFAKGYNYTGMRMGQAFHTHFKLEKITNEEDKIFCDRVYELDGDEARKVIESITDYAH